MEENLEYFKRLSQLYLFIILKYRGYIEKAETKSVADLPKLITPNDTFIKKMSDDIKSEFASYFYDVDFYAASLQAFNRVKSNIVDFSFPIQFWLKPKDILSLGISDEIGKNTLLCSILIGLGNYSSKVLVSFKNYHTYVFTYYEFNSKLFLMSFNDSIRVFDNNKELFNYIKIDETTSAYEFNNISYFNIA